MVINLNEIIKVKLTQFGVDIYYHQYDKLNDWIKERGGKPIKRCMPEIDEDGYTQFQIWSFMELYEKYFHIGCPNDKLPCDLNIVLEVEDD